MKLVSENAKTISRYIDIKCAKSSDFVNDEAVHLLEVLKCYLLSISKLLAESEVMADAK